MRILLETLGATDIVAPKTKAGNNRFKWMKFHEYKFIVY